MRDIIVSTPAGAAVTPGCIRRTGTMVSYTVIAGFPGGCWVPLVLALAILALSLLRAR